MRVKQLKNLLRERGVECAGCAEKDDLVKRVVETIHMPVVHGEAPQTEEAAQPASEEPAEEHSEPALPTHDEIAKMRVKQLKSLLRERGQDCKGCAEKSDYVKQVQETIHLPVK